MVNLGLESEGCIDPWAFLSALREKNLALGVQYIKASVTGFLFETRTDRYESDYFDKRHLELNRSLSGVVIKPEKTDAAPRSIRSRIYVNCAGPWAGEVAKMAGIGTGPDYLSVPIPIEPRKRYVFVFHCPDGPGLNMPYLVDPSGVWCRLEGVGQTYCRKSKISSKFCNFQISAKVLKLSLGFYAKFKLIEVEMKKIFASKFGFGLKYCFFIKILCPNFALDYIYLILDYNSLSDYGIRAYF